MKYDVLSEVTAIDIMASAKANKLTMKEVCKEAGVSAGTFSRAVNGKSFMTGRTVNKLLVAIHNLSEVKYDD